MKRKIFSTANDAHCRTRSCVTTLIASLVMLIAMGSTVTANAQAVTKRFLLALSKADHTLAMVNPVTLKVVARIPVGEDPHEVIASPDGKTAYVTNYGGGRFHQLYVVDLINRKALPVIDTRPFMGPHGLATAEGKIYFTAEGSKSVARYDPETQKIDWCMGTGQDRTHMIYVTQDAREIYTTNVSSATVSILKDTLMGPPMGPPPGAPSGQKQPSAQMPPPGFGPHMDWQETVIGVGKGSEGFDVSPDGKELWTAAAQDGTISVIDIAAKKVIYTIYSNAVGANRLRFTPDGKRVLVSSLRSGDLLIYDVTNRQLVKRLSLGRGAAGILVDPDGKRAFIGCTPDNYVALVDLKTLEVTGHINVGGGPDGLAWADVP